jgi:hypothetical protein
VACSRTASSAIFAFNPASIRRLVFFVIVRSVYQTERPLSNLTPGPKNRVHFRFAIHAELALQLMDRAFNERARRDLQRGVDQGRFTLENVDIAARLIMATLLTLMRAILEDRAEPRLIIESVALQLRMLGAPVKEASRIVRQPLPDIAQSVLK